MTPEINRFIKCVMQNEYEEQKEGSFVKITNNDFDVIYKLKRNTIESAAESCVVVDKRKRPVIYNDISVAFSRLCKVKI